MPTAGRWALRAVRRRTTSSRWRALLPVRRLRTRGALLGLAGNEQLLGFAFRLPPGESDDQPRRGHVVRGTAALGDERASGTALLRSERLGGSELRAVSDVVRPASAAAHHHLRPLGRCHRRENRIARLATRAAADEPAVVDDSRGLRRQSAAGLRLAACWRGASHRRNRRRSRRRSLRCGTSGRRPCGGCIRCAGGAGTCRRPRGLIGR